MTAAKRKKLRCAECRKWFPPKREWQKFCGRKCRNDNANRLRKEALASMRAISIEELIRHDMLITLDRPKGAGKFTDADVARAFKVPVRMVRKMGGEKA